MNATTDMQLFARINSLFQALETASTYQAHLELEALSKDAADYASESARLTAALEQEQERRKQAIDLFLTCLDKSPFRDFYAAKLKLMQLGDKAYQDTPESRAALLEIDGLIKKASDPSRYAAELSAQAGVVAMLAEFHYPGGISRESLQSPAESDNEKIDRLIGPFAQAEEVYPPAYYVYATIRADNTDFDSALTGFNLASEAGLTSVDAFDLFWRGHKDRDADPEGFDAAKKAFLAALANDSFSALFRAHDILVQQEKTKASDANYKLLNSLAKDIRAILSKKGEFDVSCVKSVGDFYNQLFDRSAIPEQLKEVMEIMQLIKNRLKKLKTEGKESSDEYQQLQALLGHQNSREETRRDATGAGTPLMTGDSLMKLMNDLHQERGAPNYDRYVERLQSLTKRIPREYSIADKLSDLFKIAINKLKNMGAKTSHSEPVLSTAGTLRQAQAKAHAQKGTFGFMFFKPQLKQVTAGGSDVPPPPAQKGGKH